MPVPFRPDVRTLKLHRILGDNCVLTPLGQITDKLVPEELATFATKDDAAHYRYDSPESKDQKLQLFVHAVLRVDREIFGILAQDRFTGEMLHIDALTKVISRCDQAGD